MIGLQFSHAAECGPHAAAMAWRHVQPVWFTAVIRLMISFVHSPLA